jgi:hypothetical protein
VQNYALGTLRETPDGEKYRYAKAGTLGVRVGYGAAFMNRCYSSGALSLNEAVHVSADAGAYTIVMEQASVEANAFAGGYCTIGGGNATTERHRIVSNTASAASTNHVTITLDTPLITAITAATEWVECMVNPWSDTQCIATAGNEYATFAGIPAVNTTNGRYYWCQTTGIVWIVPGGGDAPGATARSREVYFVGDGSVNDGTTGTMSTGLQKAGVCVQRDASGEGGPPYVLLQIE